MQLFDSGGYFADLDYFKTYNNHLRPIYTYICFDTQMLLYVYPSKKKKKKGSEYSIYTFT